MHATIRLALGIAAVGAVAAPQATAATWHRYPAAERAMLPLARQLRADGYAPVASSIRCAQRRSGYDVRCSLVSHLDGRRIRWAGYVNRQFLSECSDIVWEQYSWRSVLRAKGRRVGCLDMGLTSRLP